MNTTSNDEFDWEKETITQRALFKKKMPPLTFLVEDLLVTPGLAVLAGKKKLGKSWMTLQLAQSVASGAPFLGKDTRQGNVVYLALEDGERRLKQRLQTQGADSQLPIRYSTWWPAINGVEGFKALIDIIKEKTPVLVVIDTLASARDTKAKENEADSMADLFNALHTLAIGGKTVILIVAHHGKKSYGDVGFDIRGSSAIPGATDANLGLYKNSDGTFTLEAEGRDIPEVGLRIKFDAETTWTWQALGDDRDLRRIEAEARILDVIEGLGSAYAADIAKELGISRPTIYGHLKRMREENRVECEVIEKQGGGKKFLYKLPQKTTKTGATTPTRLPSKQVKGSRQVGEVGAESSETDDDILNDEDEDELTDDEARKMMKELRDLPDGTDVSKLIASYLPG